MIRWWHSRFLRCFEATLVSRKPNGQVFHAIPHRARGGLLVIVLIDDIAILQGSSVDEASRTR